MQKYDTTAAVKTHGLIDATYTEVAFSNLPLDSSGTLLRRVFDWGVGGVAGWFGRGKKEGLSNNF